MLRNFLAVEGGHWAPTEAALASGSSSFGALADATSDAAAGAGAASAAVAVSA